MTLACVYLARAAEGLEPVRSFLASYRTHGSGAEHTLLVIYKGWDTAGLAAARAVFADMPHQALLMEDEGFDIGSYLRAARQVAGAFDYLCLLNTFSRIQSEGWLGKLISVAMAPEIGAVAATASFESHSETAHFIEHVLYAYRHGTLPEPPPNGIGAKELYSIFFPKKMPRGLNKWVGAPAQTLARRLWHAAGMIPVEKHMARAFSEGRRRAWTAAYDPFPNVHLRTNALVIRTELLNSFDFPIPRSKFDAYAFESGPQGLSARIRKMGLGLRVVGADGIGYAPPDWPRAGTFRSLDQYNLLVSDNQTQAYDQLSPNAKLAYQFVSWGTAMMAPLPGSFPRFGMAFDASSVTEAGCPEGQPIAVSSAM